MSIQNVNDYLKLAARHAEEALKLSDDRQVYQAQAHSTLSHAYATMALAAATRDA